MPPGPPRSVRRCLFGRPTDNTIGEELEKKLDDTLKAKQEEWRFNFKTDRPLDVSDADFEPLSVKEVPSFYHPRTHKKNGVVCTEVPSTSTTQCTIRITRATKRRLQTTNGTNNEATPQKQASIMNYLHISKRRSGKFVCPEKTPAKLLRSDSSESSSPFRYVSAEAEKRTRFGKSPSPMVSPRKSPRKHKTPQKKSSPRKGLLAGKLRRNILAD